MANEKIIINEVTPTSSSAYVTSSDIVYVPGLMFLGEGKGKAVANTPVLCNTVKDFEAAFGSTAYIMTSADVAADLSGNYSAGDEDLSYIYAKTLIQNGISVLYEYVQGADPEDTSAINKLYRGLKSAYDALSDKGEFSVKYITSGGYASYIDLVATETTSTVLVTLSAATSEASTHVYPVAKWMLDCAAARGDAVALIDYGVDNTAQAVFNSIQTTFTSTNFKGNASYGTMFAPYGTYSIDDTDYVLPMSFGYLLCLATAIKSSPNWLAMAGVTRGVVPYLTELKDRITNVFAENCQPKKGSDSVSISMNCCTTIRPYGLTIWGNRTLLPVPTDKETLPLNLLNTRNMSNDIKKLLYSTARSLMFEQSTDTLWLKFKSQMSPMLEGLRSGNGIYDYKLIRATVKSDGSDLGRGEMAANVKIFPVAPNEYFELTVEVSDQDVSVS